MAGGEVGSVYITVRAVTDKVASDIEKAFAGVNTGSIAASGTAVADAFSKSVSKGLSPNIFTKVGESLSNFGGEAGSAREKLADLTTTGYTTGTAVGSLLGAVSSLIGGLGGLIGVVGGAMPALAGLAGAFVTVKAGVAVAELAFQGISSAVQKAISQNQAYGMTVAQLHKQMQDLAFAAEDAANAETRAGLNLEKARNNLMRMQDLPPNSLVRREAMQSYKEAETAYRQAKARAKDAKAEAANPNAFKTPKADPYAGLTPTQKAFAKFLVESKSKLDELKEAAAKGFLPVLQKDMQTLYTTVFPTFKKGISDIAVGLAGVANNLTDAIKDPRNVQLLGIVMKNIGDNLPIMGNIMGNIYSGMLTVLKASDPLVKRFLDFLNTKTKSLSDWLKAKDATGELQTFFDKAGNIMDKLWKIFEHAMGGLGAIIGANFEPGSGGWIMLDWLEKVTKKWDDMDKTVAGKKSLKTYFQDTAINSTKILDAIGALGDQFLKLGANPNIGKTFDALADPKAVTAMGNLGKTFVDAGPALGKFVADIVIFIDKITDSKAITNFFNVMDGAVKALTKFVSIPGVSYMLTTLGLIHASLFGIKKITGLAGFGFKYMGENVDVLKKAWGGFSSFFDTSLASKLGNLKTIGATAFNAFKAPFLKIGPWLMEALAPIGTAVLEFFAALTPAGWIAIAIAAITAFFAWFFTQTDIGKKMWADMSQFFMDAWANVTKFFQDAWNAVVAFFKPATDVIVSIFKTSGDIMRGVIDVITAIFKIAFVAIGWVVQIAWDGIVAGFKAVSAFLKPILDAIAAFFKPIFEGIGKFVGAVWKGIQDGFKSFVTWLKPALDPIFGFFKTVFGNISSFFKTIMNGMIGFAEGFVNFFIDGLNGIIGAINKINLPIPPLLQGVFGGAKNLGFNIAPVAKLKLPRLAEGGTVMPSTGGSLVNVAEAGRPERIEPLDQNGLSNRDKALIKYLSGGAAGGIQLNVYPSAGMDERELAAVVSRQLAFELRKGGI